MSSEIEFRRLVLEPRLVSELDGFVPAIVDTEYLRALDVTVVPSDATLAGLIRGSREFSRRLASGTLHPRSRIVVRRTDPAADLEIHNYTGACPTLTYEVNPVSGCHVGCLYCLVSDGAHEQELVLWENTPDIVARVLEQRFAEPHFFYFSPKTEALQEPTLESGMAHEILRVFISHFERHPESLARLFVASKAGATQLACRHGGESILDLFGALRGRMQYNTSVSILPEVLRRLLEPFAPSLEERLAAVRMCRDMGVMACSALVQPIATPCLTDELIDHFLGSLRASGIVNFKPELLTVSPECLAMIGQVAGHLDRGLEKALYEAYISPGNDAHKKQRDRTAPEHELSHRAISSLVAASARFDMSVSICAWVRAQLRISPEEIPLVNHNGFQCLGYQTRLFEEPKGVCP